MCFVECRAGRLARLFGCQVLRPRLFCLVLVSVIALFELRSHQRV